MRISKEKLDRLKKGSRRAGRAIAAGGKSTVYEGGAGVVAAYAADMLDKNFQFAREKPWVKGAALVAVGHVVKKKKSLGSVGAALCGAGGLLLGQYLKQRQANKATSSNAPASAPAVTTTANDAQGIYGYPGDTGMVFTSAVTRKAA